ncbi:MAG: adenylate/guanylate cyclase domain-containing protein [Acidimicrobiia bacterium]
MAAPEVRYAQNAGVNIAYQVFGGGPRDLVFVCGTMSHLELFWADRLSSTMLERLGRFSRVILFDKPGTGLSDPIPAAPTVDQRTADIVAVMDAAGSERAVVVGYSEGGIPALMLAAGQPQRVDALVLLDTLVAMDWAPDMGITREKFDHIWEVIDEACERWGQGVLMSMFAPTLVGHPFYGSRLGSIEQACMSPGMARSVLQGYHGMDMREVAASIHVPTLVLHASGDQMVPCELGRDLARRIDGARFVELVGPDHLIWTHNAEQFPDAVEEFVTGGHHAPSDENRVLTTIVFTDIVDSTRQIATLGDASWRAILADHDRRMDELLDHFDGEAIKHTGDGRLAHFARPARAVRFATAMATAARSCGIEIRAGIHTGECESVNGDLFGLAVNIAARVAALAPPGEVLVSSTVKDLVFGSGLTFTIHGEHELKGAPGPWSLYRCADDRPGPLVATGYDTDVRHEVSAAPSD